MTTNLVGQSLTRVDALGKVTGETLFPGDLTATLVNTTPNCTENIYDLSVALDNWLKCNNPNPDACP